MVVSRFVRGHLRHIHLDVLLAALCRQPDLLLPLAEARLVGLAGFADALVARDALLPFRPRLVFGQHGAAAGMAQLVRSFPQPVADRDTPVEDEAFAVPRALFFGHALEILQDTALEVIDILD